MGVLTGRAELRPWLPPLATVRAVQEWSDARGKRVIITGATHGIGLAAAEELAQRGTLLAIVARSKERADQAVSAITRAGGAGTEVDVLIGDLSSQESVRAVAAEALQRYPRIDVLSTTPACSMRSDRSRSTA